MNREPEWPRPPVAAELPHFVGVSPALKATVATIRKLAACDAHVVILGETGTGKELAARAIHYLGERSDRPFIPVNCGAIPDSLLESEFFGHARGAFTDAREARDGLIAMADTGTLFLDEIECLSAKGQVILLRFLQDQVWRPVGARNYRRSDLRIIAASNQDMDEMVACGIFRADLRFRLGVLWLTMPALRHRPEDLAPLTRHFLDMFARRYRRPAKSLDERSLALLGQYSWPGNVRELENLIHREFVLGAGLVLTIRPETLGLLEGPPADGARTLPATGPDASFRTAKASAVAAFERAYLVELLTRAGGNVSLAARIAGKDRSRLGKLLKKHGLSRESFGPTPSLS